MANKERISISINKTVLKRMDVYLKKIGLGCNRSGMIEKVVNEFLKVEDGKV